MHFHGSLRVQGHLKYEIGDLLEFRAGDLMAGWRKYYGFCIVVQLPLTKLNNEHSYHLYSVSEQRVFLFSDYTVEQNMTKL